MKENYKKDCNDIFIYVSHDCKPLYKNVMQYIVSFLGFSIISLKKSAYGFTLVDLLLSFRWQCIVKNDQEILKSQTN